MSRFLLTLVVLSHMLPTALANYVITENFTISTSPGKVGTITTSLLSSSLRVQTLNSPNDKNQSYMIWNNKGAFVCVIQNKTCMRTEKKPYLDPTSASSDTMKIQLTKLSITPTQQVLKIANHSCNVYQIHREYISDIKTLNRKSKFTSLENNCYATKLQILPELYKKNQLDIQKISMGPSLSPQLKASVIKEFNLGYPLKRESQITEQVLGSTTAGSKKQYSTQYITTSIQNKSLPQSYFEVPKDYKTIELPTFSAKEFDTMMNPKSPTDIEAMKKKIMKMQNSMPNNR